MSMQDPIADMLTRIRNAQAVNEKNISLPASRLKKAMLSVLQQEGYIDSFDVITESENKSFVKIELRYYQGKPVIQKIKRISKPSLRVYKSAVEMPSIDSGMGVVIVSTSQGIMTGAAAKALNLGGEILCSVE